MWPFSSWFEKKEEVVTPTPEPFEFSISHSGLDRLMKFDCEVRELLWDLLERRATHANTKFIEEVDVEEMGGQVITALKQLIEEYNAT